MKKLKNKKIHILIVIYVILIIVELFFFVPYHWIQVFRSEQNVPHSVIIGSGYTTMADISSDNAYLWKVHDANDGKKVNTPQLLINVSITTVVAIAIYLLLRKNENV